MAQSIITKYISPTNRLPGRVKATCWRKTVTINWRDNLDVSQNHKAAAEALIKEIQDDSDYMWGIVAHAPTPDDSGRVFVIEVE